MHFQLLQYILYLIYVDVIYLLSCKMCLFIWYKIKYLLYQYFVSIYFIKNNEHLE